MELRRALPGFVLLSWMYFASVAQAQTLVDGPYRFTIERTAPTVLLRVQVDPVLCGPPPTIAHTSRITSGAVVRLSITDECTPGPLPPADVRYDLGTFAIGQHELHFEYCGLPPPGGCQPFATLPFAVTEGADWAFFIPPTQERDIRLAPGQATFIEFAMIQNAAQTQPWFFASSYYSQPTALSEYVFTPDQSAACPPPKLTQFGIAFEGPGGPGSKTCRYWIHRVASSIHDLSFSLSGLGQGLEAAQPFHFGTLPDQSLSIEPAAPANATEALMRLTLHNHSDVEGITRVANTGCLRVIGGDAPAFQTTPFTVETNFPGACPLASEAGARNWICLSKLESYQNHLLSLGPAPAHGSASCLVRLRFETPDALGANVALRMSEPGGETAAGGRVFDVKPGNDRVRLGAQAVFAGSFETPGPFE